MYQPMQETMKKEGRLMENSLNDVCDRLQEKFNLLDEAVKELKKALINVQESLSLRLNGLSNKYQGSGLNV